MTIVDGELTGRKILGAAAGIQSSDQKEATGAQSASSPSDQAQVTKAMHQYGGNAGAAKGDIQGGHRTTPCTGKKTLCELDGHFSNTGSGKFKPLSEAGLDVTNHHEGRGRDDGGCRGLQDAFASWLAGAERAVNQ